MKKSIFILAIMLMAASNMSAQWQDFERKFLQDKTPSYYLEENDPITGSQRYLISEIEFSLDKKTDDISFFNEFAAKAAMFPEDAIQNIRINKGRGGVFLKNVKELKFVLRPGEDYEFLLTTRKDPYNQTLKVTKAIRWQEDSDVIKVTFYNITEPLINYADSTDARKMMMTDRQLAKYDELLKKYRIQMSELCHYLNTTSSASSAVAADRNNTVKQLEELRKHCAEVNLKMLNLISGMTEEEASEETK